VVPDAVVLDELGARLELERTGARLYEALIAKLDARGGFAGGPTRSELIDLRDQEHGHAALACCLIARLGGDPDEQTPAAAREAAARHALDERILDPRTSLLHAMRALAATEESDRRSWELLYKRLAYLVDGDPLTASVRSAHDAEERHVFRLRTWIAAAPTWHAHRRAIRSERGDDHEVARAAMVTPNRIDVRMPPSATTREQRELGAFVRFCVGRVERGAGAFDRWVVTIAIDRDEGFRTTIVVALNGSTFEASGHGRDGTLAAWNAINNLQRAVRPEATGTVA
jgi:hypothetical protein